MSRGGFKCTRSVWIPDPWFGTVDLRYQSCYGRTQGGRWGPAFSVHLGALNSGDRQLAAPSLHCHPVRSEATVGSEPTDNCARGSYEHLKADARAYPRRQPAPMSSGPECYSESTPDGRPWSLLEGLVFSNDHWFHRRLRVDRFGNNQQGSSVTVRGEGDHESYVQKGSRNSSAIESFCVNAPFLITVSLGGHYRRKRGGRQATTILTQRAASPASRWTQR